MAFKVSLSVTGILFVASILTICFGSDANKETGLQFIEEPQSLIVQKYHEAMLNCLASGASGSEVEILWRKDGTEVVPDKRISIYDNGSLYIRRVMHNLKRQMVDEGRYECVAANHIGAIVSRRAFLQVADLNHFSGQPQSSVVSEGETVHFRCQITGVPKPTVTWVKNNQPLPNSQRYLQLASYSLLIFNATLEDAGFYSCQAKNVAGERDSRAAELAVRQGEDQQPPQPPRLLIEPKDHNAVVGETVILECAATGLRGVGGGGADRRRGAGAGQAAAWPPLIAWTRKDGARLRREQTSALGSHSLEIRNVQENDTGVYQCSLPDWPDVPAAQTTLTVLVPPHPVEVSPNIALPTAHTVRMTCSFDGLPAPSIVWMRNAEVIKSNGRIKVKLDSSTLLIAQSETSDSGIYQCWAENAAGRIGATIRLYINSSDSAPDPPVGLQARTLTSRSIELSWDESPPKNGRMTMAYSVHYLPTEGGGELQKVVSETLAVIEQLQPNTEYMFYVVAYNERSASQHSKPVFQRTSEDIPLSAPEVQVFSAGATVLKVQWEDLPADRARGAITRYQIFYRKHGQETQNIIRVNDRINQYSITGLETGARYDVRILAGTQVGFPTLSDEQWPWTSETVQKGIDVGVSSMRNVQFVVIDSMTIRLSWDLPASIRVELLGFKISYRAQDSSEEPRMIILDIATNHTIHQLEPETSYEVGVCPFTDLGDGDLVTKTVRTLSEGSTIQGPPVPTAVSAEPLNDTAIVLSWSILEYEDAPLTHYTVRYLAVTSNNLEPSDNESAVQSIESLSPQVVIVDLTPFTVYQFTVQSHTSSSHSEQSREVRCRTKEGRPDAPQNVILFLLAPTDIQVNWQSPPVTNGVVVSYIVYYSDNKTSPISQWLSQVENGTATTSAIIGLKATTLYYIKVQATTLRSEGQFSKTAEIWTRDLYQSRRKYNGTLNTYSDRTMGIIIGFCISGGCILICIIIIVVLRRRPFIRGQSRPMHSVNGYAAATHDRRLGSNYPVSVCTTVGDGKEADCSAHMLHKSQENEHVDSKGGPMVRKKLDGKRIGDATKANGVMVHSNQNGGVTEGLLSQHKSTELEMTEVSKMSPHSSTSAVAEGDFSCSTDCCSNGRATSEA